MSAGIAAGFDPAFYLASNPDVAAIGSDPLEHYLRHGKQEGRPANEAEWLAKNAASRAPAQTNEQKQAAPEAQAFAQNDPYGFDDAWYRKTYANLGLGTGANAAKQHYLQYGMQDGLSRNPFQAAGGYGQSINPAAGQFIDAPAASGGLDPKDPASWAAFQSHARAETQGLNRLPYMAPNSATLSADPLSVQKQFYPAGNNFGYLSSGQGSASASPAPGAAPSPAGMPVAATGAAAALGTTPEQLAQMVQQATGGVANLGMGAMAFNPLSGAGYRR